MPKLSRRSILLYTVNLSGLIFKSKCSYKNKHDSNHLNTHKQSYTDSFLKVFIFILCTLIFCLHICLGEGAKSPGTVVTYRLTQILNVYLHR